MLHKVITLAAPHPVTKHFIICSAKIILPIVPRFFLMLARRRVFAFFHNVVLESKHTQQQQQQKFDAAKTSTISFN